MPDSILDNHPRERAEKENIDRQTEYSNQPTQPKANSNPDQGSPVSGTGVINETNQRQDQSLSQNLIQGTGPGKQWIYMYVLQSFCLLPTGSIFLIHLAPTTRSPQA